MQIVRKEPLPAAGDRDQRICDLRDDDAWRGARVTEVEGDQTAVGRAFVGLHIEYLALNTHEPTTSELVPLPNEDRFGSVLRPIQVFEE